MSLLVPTFGLSMIGGANTVAKDDWYDISALSTTSDGGAYSPIPNGVQLWVGFLWVYCGSKALAYELRVNNATKSLGNTTDTTILAYVASDPTSGTVQADMYENGNIVTMAPVSASTGSEKLWLRVTSGTGTVASFTWFLFFATYQ